MLCSSRLLLLRLSTDVMRRVAGEGDGVVEASFPASEDVVGSMSIADSSSGSSSAWQLQRGWVGLGIACGSVWVAVVGC